MIGNRFYTWFKNYYQWVGGAFNETLLLPLVRATAGLRAGAIRYDETTNTVETYDGTNWNAIPSATGFVPNSRTITINGTTFDLSTNRIYSVGTVTSVGLDTGSAGTDINVSGSPVSVSGNITLNIPTASATNRGALSSADWTTFNNKVSTSRQLTINGTAFDLSADRTWSVGTVTSVAASAPLSVSGSATTTPVITITQANSTTNGFLSSTDWNTFNNKQNALTLTTTGNSGASTLVGATINVPEYTLSGLGGVPTTRTLTINGTALDLSANRSWSVGTVTSVGLTSATSGVTITDSPVTVSGTIGIAIATANGSQQGLLSGTDWTTFNNKQNALTLTTTGTSGAASLIGATLNVPQYQAQGNYITSLTGEATASGPGAASVTLSTTAVTGKLLTGLNLSGGGTIAATDSILQAFGKVQNQISAMVGGVMYQGTWNASTNTPTLTSSVGTKGNYYIVDVSGTTNLNGITDWRVGDWAIFNGSTWDKVDNTDAVSSVNGFTGAVSLTTSHIAEGTNLYYLDSRSRTAISLTTTGNSGAATYDNVSGIINVPQYTLAGLGGVPTTRQLTINGTAFDLSADRSWSVGTVTSVGLNSTTSGITITNTPVTSSGALTINIATASGSQNGLLSSTDWNSFNTGLGELIVSVAFTPTDLQLTKANSQVIGATVPLANGSQVGFLSTTDYNTFNNKIGGSGTSGQVAYFNGTNSVTGESNLFWDAANDRLGIGTSSPAARLDVSGTIRATNGVFQLFEASAFRGGLYPYNSWLGSGTDYTPTLASETGLYFAVSGSATRAMTLDASGRLGIGNPAPTYTLEINSGASQYLNARFYGSSHSLLMLESTTAARQAILVHKSPTREWTVGLETNGNYIWYDNTAAAHRMRLDNSGNLGLGVTPSAWNANSRALQLPQFVSLSHQNNASLNLMSFALETSANTFTYADTGVFPLRYNQNPNNGAHSWHVAGTGTAGNAISFTQAMTLTSAGDFLIGSTSVPANGANTRNVVFHNSNNVSTFVKISNGTTGATASDGFDLIMGTSSETYLYNRENGDMIFGTNNTERMRITSGGSIGIGTNSPDIFGRGDGFDLGISSAGLGASQNMSLQLNAGGSAGRGAQIYMGQGGTRHFTISSNATESTIGTTSNTPLRIETNSVERMRITSGGNVGIGTTTPNLLTWNRAVTINTATGNSALELSIGDAAQAYFAADASDIFLGAYANKNLKLRTNNADRVTITSGGDVGIGTTSPTSQLNLSADSGSTLTFTRSGSADGNGVILSVGNTGVENSRITLGGGSNNALIFGTGSSGTERMRIHSNGGLKFNPQSAAPTAEAGTVYYDSDDNKLKVYNGTSWVDLH